MSESISQRELRNDSARIMRALGAGDSFVVTSNGQPVGELRPLRRHTFVDASAVVEVFRNAPEVEWRRLRDDLDAVADQDATPRA
ncbi:antitoxin (DNA-binding transcriptional repressor) of toxin-antitoxin stability system [Motilibacter peucedani]|uniref:Antitoxin (DNA-binding transcriptional repressor) of toxin-antitoxin stability system n=1 Tax=Motilibacter peucedani TaxID=598650 RepID=A0A420XRN9_9ACTN|nr:hypothetical protein [Motilibacter peucedani]RKS77479.1 antitoxin (DNA-binding transcriptional repressor) of toxin-antitoxin stability system [Motilibacter peucedani]